MNMFWGTKIFFGYFKWGQHKTGLVFGAISMHIRVSFLGQGTEWG